MLFLVCNFLNFGVFYSFLWFFELALVCLDTHLLKRLILSTFVWFLITFLPINYFIITVLVTTKEHILHPQMFYAAEIYIFTNWSTTFTIKAVLSTLAGFFYYYRDVLVSLTFVKQFKMLEKEDKNKLKKDLTLFGVLKHENRIGCSWCVILYFLYTLLVHLVSYDLFPGFSSFQY